MLSNGMIRIGECYCEWIGEYGCRIMEKNAVIFPIHFRLFGVPLELHFIVPLFQEALLM